MGGYEKVLSKQLATADADGVAQSQTLGSAENFVLNGALVTAGVGIFDTARRVYITSGGDDSGITFTVVGTGYNHLAQTEVVTGGSTAAVFTIKDYLTVTRVSSSAATAAAVTVGTGAVGSTAPFIVDRFVNPATLTAAMVFTGTVTASIQESLDYLAPQWDLNSNTVTWFDTTNFDSVATNKKSTIQGPVTMLRLTVESGTGSVSATILTPVLFGGV